jgi:hypothetical protein
MGVGKQETLNNVVPMLWGHQKRRTKSCPWCGDVRNAEQSHTHAVGTSETSNKVLPMALADIVTQQFNCFFGVFKTRAKKPARFSPSGVFL